MNKNVKKLIAGITSYGFILTSTLTSVMASPLSASSVGNTRLGGADRYETAAIVANNGWSTSSDYVIIARGDDFADALCATPLSKRYNAPVLLTESNKLNSSTKAEIVALKPKHIIIVGGTGAVSSGVEKELNSLASDVQRVAGKDRYETSVKVANALGKSTKIAVVRGDKFTDALSIAPIAAAQGMPVILTKTKKLPDEVKSYLDANKISVSYVIGGTGAVSDAVKAELPGADRISGSDRFDTNKNVLENFADDLNFEKVFVAVGDGSKGNEFADALTASALAAQTSSPVILEYKGIKTSTVNFVSNTITPKTTVIPVGGTAVVSDNDVKTLTLSKKDYSTDGKTYSSEQVSTNADITGKNVTFKDGKISGNVYVYGDGAQLSNVQVSGTVFVDPGENGSVTLHGVKADRIKVLSGAQNSVHLNDVSANALLVESKNTGASVRVVCEGNTSIVSTIVKSNVMLDDVSGTFGTVEVKPAGTESKEVVLSGKFAKPVIAEGSVELKAASGAQIAEVIVNTISANAVVNLADGNLGNVTVENASKIEIGATAKVNITPASADAAKGLTLDVADGADVTVPKDSGITLTGAGAADVKTSETTTVTGGGSSSVSYKYLTIKSGSVYKCQNIPVIMSNTDTMATVFDNNKGLLTTLLGLSSGSSSLDSKIANKTIGGQPINVYIADILAAKGSNDLAAALNTAGKVDFSALQNYINSHSFAQLALLFKTATNGDVNLAGKTIAANGVNISQVTLNTGSGDTTIYNSSSKTTVSVSDIRGAFGLGSSTSISSLTASQFLNYNIDLKVYGTGSSTPLYELYGTNGTYTIKKSGTTIYTITLQ